MSIDIEAGELNKEMATKEQEDSLRENYLKLLDVRNKLHLNFQRSKTELEIKKASIEKIFKLSCNKRLEDSIHYITYTVEELGLVEQPKENAIINSKINSELPMEATEIITENVVEIREEVFSDGDLVDSEVIKHETIEVVKTSTNDQSENNSEEIKAGDRAKDNPEIIPSRDSDLFSNKSHNTIVYEKTQEIVEKIVHRSEYKAIDDNFDNPQEESNIIRPANEVREEFLYEKSEKEVEKIFENTPHEIREELMSTQNEESYEIVKMKLPKEQTSFEKIKSEDTNFDIKQNETKDNDNNHLKEEPQDILSLKIPEETVSNQLAEATEEKTSDNLSLNQAKISIENLSLDKFTPNKSQPEISIEKLEETNENNPNTILNEKTTENIINIVPVLNDQAAENFKIKMECILPDKSENNSDHNNISASTEKDSFSDKPTKEITKPISNLKKEESENKIESADRKLLPTRSSVKKLSISNSTTLENQKQLSNKLNMKPKITKKNDLKKLSSDEESDDNSHEVKKELAQNSKMPSVNSKKVLDVKKPPEKKIININKQNTKPVLKFKQEEKAGLEKIKEDKEYNKIASHKNFEIKNKNSTEKIKPSKQLKLEEADQEKKEVHFVEKFEEEKIPEKDNTNTEYKQEMFSTEDAKETYRIIEEKEEVDENNSQIKVSIKESSDKKTNEEFEAYQKHFLNLVPKRESKPEKQNEKKIDLEIFSSATKFLEDILIQQEEELIQNIQQENFKTLENNPIPKIDGKEISNDKMNVRIGERKHSTKKMVNASKEKLKRSEEESKLKKRDLSGKKKEDIEKNPFTSTISKRDLSGHKKEFLEGKFSESKEKFDNSRHKSKENKKILETNKSKNFRNNNEPESEKGKINLINTGKSSKIKNKVEFQQETKVNTDPSQQIEKENLIEENDEKHQISILEDKNLLLESNYITINLDIPDNRPNLDIDMLNSTQNNENLNDTRADGNDEYTKYKKRVTNHSEYYQDEITRYDYDDSKIIETDKSMDCEKKIVNEKAYVTNYSSTAYKYNSYFLTNKLEDELDISEAQKKPEENLHNEENKENDLFEEKIQKFENHFLVQEETSKVEEKIQNETNEELIIYTDDVDDVVNYETMKSPITRTIKAPDHFIFDANLAKDFDELEKKNVDLLNETNILDKEKEKFENNTIEVDLNLQNNEAEEINYDTVKNNEQKLYLDYKTNIENDLLISLDQYKSELIENIPEDYKLEKIQQIQESAKRQYELLTKANSLETIHEVRSVIFNNETDDEKYFKKSSKEIIILDEGEDKNILIDEGRITNKRNSAKISSKFSLKNPREEKLTPVIGSNNDSSNIDKKFHKTLLEVKRSAKIFNTKKWDTKPLDGKLKLIQNKIQPIKIPPKPKLIPNSNHTERAGCFSPKPIMRSSMPLIKEMGSIDICFVCKGAVVKPKQCRRCMKCVCHVCSFELEDRNKCPDCNSQLVMATKTASTTTTINIKKIPVTEKKPTSSSSILVRKDGHRTSAIKQKYKSEIIYGCCNCKDSTIASINCPKCGKSSCVMCLNNSNDPNKCLSCQCNFKSRYSTLNGSQTITRKLSQTAKKNINTTPTISGNISSKINQKIFFTTSTKTFTTTCAMCRKSTHNRNKCTGCGKNICSLCYNNIDGEKICGDCHGNIKVKITTTTGHKRLLSDLKMTSTQPIMRPKSRQLELSNASKNLFTGEEKIEICRLCRRTKKCCNECWKIVCANCTKDSFEQNKCSECRCKKSQKNNGNFSQRLSRGDSDGYFVFDDICLVCKATPGKKINCNNCRKPVCTTCVDVVKDNESKCPNCNNVNYNVLAFIENKNESNETISSEIKTAIPQTPQKNTQENEKPNQFAGKCLICARVPYNELKCNYCKNEVCFTCTYSMEDQYKCPQCPGVLMITEKKDKEIEHADRTLLETPKNNKSQTNTTYKVLNQDNQMDAFSPIQPINQVDDTNLKNPTGFAENIPNTSTVVLNNVTQIPEAPSTPKKHSNHKEKLSPAVCSTLVDNCLICKGAPIKAKICTTCNKSVCKMCSYEIDDNKCPGCRTELNLVDAYQNEKNLKPNTVSNEINKDITNTKIEEKSDGIKHQDLCLVCKGFPIKPKTCDNCNTSVCTICSYELEDPSKCQECKGPYKKLGTKGSMKFKVGQHNHEANEKKTIQDTSMSFNGPSCIVCKRPPFKPKICWSCMSAIFCTPCSFNFEDSNRCLNCQTKFNRETEILKSQNNSKMCLNTSGI